MKKPSLSPEPRRSPASAETVGPRLVPGVLASVVTTLVPRELGGDGILRLTDLHQPLDQKFSEHQQRLLRSLILRAVQDRLHRLPKKVLDQVVPPPQVLLRSPRFDPRTKRCLEGVPASWPRETTWTVRLYLQLPRFKARCLVNLLAWAEIDAGMPQSEAPAVDALESPLFTGGVSHKGALKRLAAEIERRLPLTTSAAEIILASSSTDGAALSLSGFLARAESAGLALPFQRVQHSGVTMLVARQDAPGISACCTAAVRSMQSWGLGSVRQIVHQVRVLHQHSIDSRIARAVLSSLPLFSWLDQKGGWFWFRERPNRLVRGLGKVFSVVHTIKVDDLLTAILRSYAFRQRPGRQVIESACSQLPGYRVEGERISIERLLDRHEWLSPTELSLLEMLEQNGGKASLSLLSRLGRTWGISVTTLRMAIRRSPVVRITNASLVPIGMT